MRLKQLLLLFTIWWGLGSANLFAQNSTVTGKITSSGDNKPIVGASIVFKGSNGGVTSDENGNFSISVPSLSGTLVISSVNFIEQEVSIGGNKCFACSR